MAGYKTGNSIYSGYMMSEEEYEKKQEEMREAFKAESDFNKKLTESQAEIVNINDEEGNPALLTNEAAAAVLRLDSYKTGQNPNSYVEYSDAELVQRAKDLNHPLSDRMIGTETPTWGEVLPSIGQDLEQFFKYDLPMSGHLIKKSIQDWTWDANKFLIEGLVPMTAEQKDNFEVAIEKSREDYLNYSDIYMTLLL